MLQRLGRGLYLESVNPHKETKAVVNTCNFNAGEGETGSMKLVGQPISLVGELLFQ